MNNEIILKKLVNRRNKLKKLIENYEYYNKINKVKRNIIDVGLVANYIFPYILSLIIIFNLSKNMSKTPFIYDEIEEKGTLEIIDTSNGYHEEKITFQKEEVPKIEYYTKWKINEYGLFERKKTTYIVNDIFLNKKAEILSLTEEELNSTLIPLNHEIQTKEKIEEDDNFFLEDTIVVTTLKNTSKTKKVTETKNENLLSTIVYIIISLMIGKGINHINKIIFREKIKDSLIEKKYNYREIDEKQIEEIIEIFQINEENIELITPKVKKVQYE